MPEFAHAVGLAPSDTSPARISLICAVQLTRTGRAVRLVQDNGAAATADGAAGIAVVKLIVRAREWWRRTPYARGLVCALIWLVRHFPPAKTPLFRMILALANGSLTEAEVVDWFRAVLT